MDNLINNYINNLKISDINNFLINNDIYLSEEELLFTYNFIKENGSNIFNNTFNFSNLRNNYSIDNYNKLSILIDKYKKRY